MNDWECTVRVFFLLCVRFVMIHLCCVPYSLNRVSADGGQDQWTGFSNSRTFARPAAKKRVPNKVEGGTLRSLVNCASYGIGELEMVSILERRERAKSAGDLPDRIKTSVVTGYVRRIHRSLENADALLQVASEMSLLAPLYPQDVKRRLVNSLDDSPGNSDVAGRLWKG